MRAILLYLAVFLMSHNVLAEPNYRWIDVCEDKTVEINGLPWFSENEGRYIRLPLSGKDEISAAAWEMSLCPSTARVRFKTNSSVLAVKIDHGMFTEKGQEDIWHMSDGSRLSMWHMSAVGVSGIDLYIGEPGKQSFWKASRAMKEDGEYTHTYFKGFSGEIREFTLYLPAYAQLKTLKIGIMPDAEFLPPTAYKIQKPMVVYGTSITQGGCSSRGSNNFMGILERRMNADVVNLGFSGSGLGEAVMAELMSEIEASVYMVDSVANMSPEVMEQNYENFVRILRKNRPETPVVLMTKPHYGTEIQPFMAEYYVKQHKVLFETYDKLKSEGDEKVYLFDTGKFIQAGGDHPSVDGTHLTDVGYYKIADGLEPVLREIIGL